MKADEVRAMMMEKEKKYFDAELANIYDAIIHAANKGELSVLYPCIASPLMIKSIHKQLTDDGYSLTVSRNTTGVIGWEIAW